MTNISNGNINTTFTYDPNGNQLTGLGRSITYTSYNKPASIPQGSGTLTFSHDVDHQRFKQVSPEGITYYFDAFGSMLSCSSPASPKWYNFIGVGGSMVGVCVLGSDGNVLDASDLVLAVDERTRRELLALTARLGRESPAVQVLQIGSGLRRWLDPDSEDSPDAPVAGTLMEETVLALSGDRWG